MGCTFFFLGTTILDAIREVVGSETEVVYEPNPSAEFLASKDEFAFAIVAVGEKPYVESFGDDPELKIPLNGNEIISLVADKVPTVALLISGRPMVLESPVLEKVEAFVAAWLPGTEGRGITDVLFGDYEFQGRLPVTWFRSVEQLPMHLESNSNEDPLFPYGYGLKSKKEAKKD